MHKEVKRFCESIKSRFISHFKTEYWGSSILIMEKRGKAFMHVYWYNDDNTTIYLESLSVLSKFRNQGIGAEMLSIAEIIGVKLRATTVCLWVLWVREDTWVHDWYIRIGYKDWKDHETEINAVWMKKAIVSNGC